MINHLKAVMGAELHKVGSQHFAVVEELFGKDVRITQGLCTLLAHIVRHISVEWLQYGKDVKTIEWLACGGGATPQVLVKCNEDEVIKGNFVIVTLPLGILKKNLDCMFVPQLPAIKVNAINGLSVGHTNTVYLEYSEPWWIPNELNLRIAWSPKEYKQMSCWTKGIGCIQEVPNSKRVIMFTVGGEDAICMESFSEVEIVIEFTNFLRKLIGDKTIPFPNNVVMYRWANHPHFLGSTVFMPVGSSQALIKDLYKADVHGVDGIMPILFAGKATHDTFFGTIHGARMSGIREAERILKFIRAQKQQQQQTPAVELTDQTEKASVCSS